MFIRSDFIIAEFYLRFHKIRQSNLFFNNIRCLLYVKIIKIRKFFQCVFVNIAVKMNLAKTQSRKVFLVLCHFDEGEISARIFAKISD
ncbi:hypothetical protein DCO46_04480 [Flavobacterium sp. HTF]|nr:hypothetical protein DCO46_04480 [Flavobacterium sp. HTF]